jgi:hypothetical protein
MKVVGVFYKAHEFAKDPKFLGCMENALGLREWLVSKGHTFIATDDKEGESCGKSQIAFAPIYKLLYPSNIMIKLSTCF